MIPDTFPFSKSLRYRRLLVHSPKNKIQNNCNIKHVKLLFLRSDRLHSLLKDKLPWYWAHEARSISKRPNQSFTWFYQYKKKIDCPQVHHVSVINVTSIVFSISFFWVIYRSQKDWTIFRRLFFNLLLMTNHMARLQDSYCVVVKGSLMYIIY